MVVLAAWLGVCLAIAWLTRNRPGIGCCVALVVWVAMPGVAAPLLSGRDGGFLGAHPATYLLLVLAGWSLVQRPGDWAAELSRRYGLAVATVWVVAVAGLTSVLMGSGGAAILMDMILGPLALFWLLLVAARSQPDVHGWLRNTLLGVAVVESVLVLVQRSQNRFLVWEEQLGSIEWVDPTRFDRWMGTLDSPLSLAMLVAAAAPLVMGLRSQTLRLSILTVLLLGALVSQSRQGVLAVGVTFVVVAALGRTSLVGRILTFGAAAAGLVVLSTTAFVSTFSTRIDYDYGSSEARFRAFEAFSGYVGDVALTGEGLTTSYDFARAAGLVTSLESSPMMYAVDLGLLTAAVYFGMQGIILLRHLPTAWRTGEAASAVVAMGIPLFSSSLAYSNASAAILWSALALVALSPGARAAAGQPGGADHPAVTAPAASRAATSSSV